MDGAARRSAGIRGSRSGSASRHRDKPWGRDYKVEIEFRSRRNWRSRPAGCRAALAAATRRSAYHTRVPEATSGTAPRESKTRWSTHRGHRESGSSGSSAPPRRSPASRPASFREREPASHGDRSLPHRYHSRWRGRRLAGRPDASAPPPRPHPRMSSRGA